MVRGQVERLLAAMDVVSRDEHDAVKAMAVLARDENERLERRILALEEKLGTAATPPPGHGQPLDLTVWIRGTYQSFFALMVSRLEPRGSRRKRMGSPRPSRTSG